MPTTLRADYSQSDYNLPIANVTSLVYDLPFGRGRTFMNNAGALTDSLLGGWQISGINTLQAGTPFNITYSPNCRPGVSPQISATYRGANEYRPDHGAGQPITQGKGNRAANSGYVNYINPLAFVLPPIKDGAGNLLSPFGNASRNPGPYAALIRLTSPSTSASLRLSRASKSSFALNPTISSTIPI